MWTLALFESSRKWLIDFSNPPSWDGIIALLITALAVWLLHYRMGIFRGDPFPRKGLDILVPIAILLVLGIFKRSLLNYFVLVGWGYAIYTISIWVLSLVGAGTKGKKRYGFIALCTFLNIIIFIGLFWYQYSYPYFMPGSYPEPERSELRMLRRIIEAEQIEDSKKAKMTPLSELHFRFQGKEVIPDSIRKDATFEGYTYTFHPNTPQAGVYTIDAVPIKDVDKLPSFHVFPIPSEQLNKKYVYTVYTITMAQKNGKPATEQDRPFYKRNLLSYMYYPKFQ